MRRSSHDSTRSDVWAKEVGWFGQRKLSGKLIEPPIIIDKVAEGNRLFDNIAEATVTPAPYSVAGKKRDFEE